MHFLAIPGLGLLVVVVGAFAGVGWVAGSVCARGVRHVRLRFLVCGVVFVVPSVVSSVSVSMWVWLVCPRCVYGCGCVRWCLLLWLVSRLPGGLVVCAFFSLLCVGVGAVWDLCALSVRAGVSVCVVLCCLLRCGSWVMVLCHSIHVLL